MLYYPITSIHVSWNLLTVVSTMGSRCMNLVFLVFAKQYEVYVITDLTIVSQLQSSIEFIMITVSSSPSHRQGRVYPPAKPPHEKTKSQKKLWSVAASSVRSNDQAAPRHR